MSAPTERALERAMLSAPTTSLDIEQARRATCLAITLELVAGRSVAIQIVERIASWIYDGVRER